MNKKKDKSKKRVVVVKKNGQAVSYTHLRAHETQ